MKKLCIFLTAFTLVILCAILLPTKTQAAEVASGTCGDNLTWVLDDTGTLTISGTGPMTDYEWAESPWRNRSDIKSVVIGDDVTSIGQYAFYNCTGMTSIAIPDSVTTISSYAFQSCTRLTNVTIGSSVTHIARSAFSSCTSLTSITIPDSVTSIGDNAFGSCTGMSSITIGSSVETIAGTAFQNCTALKEVYIHDIAAWCQIDFDSFYGHGYYKTGNPLYYAKNLYLNGELVTNLIIPDGVTSIPSVAFANCSLTSVSLPDSITRIGYGAFDGCSNLTDAFIPEGVALIIDDYAFNDCTSLTSFTFPDGVTSIGYSAFGGCSNLAYITIPDSVAQFYGHAFDGCSSLSHVFYGGTAAQWKDIRFSGGSNYHSWTRVFRHYEAANREVTVNELCTVTAYHCNLCDSNIHFTDNGEQHSFTNGICTKCGVSDDWSYTVSADGNATITDYSGDGGAVTIPSTMEGLPVTSIGADAFSGCSSLTSVTIPDSVTSISYYAFEGCRNLNSVYITDLAAWCGIQFDDSDSNPLYYAHNLYVNGQLITDLVIPKGVTSIGKSAFEGCSSLTSVTIPDSVTSIGNSAFYGCSSLTSVTIPDSVTSIHAYAFKGCSSLTSITIPDSVTSIGFCAFSGCSSLWHVLYGGNKTAWQSISILGGNDNLTNAIRHYNCTGDEIIDPVNKVCSLCQANCTHSYDNNCDSECNICGTARSVSHRYKTDWSKDSTNHWHECSICGDRKDLKTHTSGAVATETTAQTCTTCGYVIKAALGHTHNFASTWTTDNNGHWHACAGCSEKGSYAAHTWNGDNCSVCGANNPNVPQPTDPTEPNTEPSAEPTEPNTQPTEPSVQPTEPSTQPTESTPHISEPVTNPTIPSTAPVAPDNSGKETGSSATWIVITAAVVLLGGGAAAGVILWKKKH